MIKNEKIMYLLREYEPDVVIKLGSEAVEGLLFGLETGSYSDRLLCAEALGEIAKKDENTFQILLSNLKEGPYLIRPGCATALGQVGSKALDSLLHHLKNDIDQDVKIACARALLYLKDPRAVGALINALKEDDSSLTESCIGTLNYILWGNSEVAEILLKELNNENALVRCGCAKVLGASHNQKAVDTLIIGLGYEKERIRIIFSNALESINNSRGLHFKKIIFDKDKDYAIKTGLENTLNTIEEYLKLIKGHYPEKQIQQIHSGLIIFYMQVAKRINASKEKMDLPVPVNLRQGKDTGFCKNLKRSIL